MTNSVFFIEYRIDKEWYIERSEEVCFFRTRQQAENYINQFSEDFEEDYDETRVVEFKRV